MKRFGFTIVELVVVIAAIAILATVALVSYNGARVQADHAIASTELQKAYDNLNLWVSANNGAVPASLAAANVAGENGATLSYVVNTTAGVFCVAATSPMGYSLSRISSASGSPVEGTCPPTLP